MATTDLYLLYTLSLDVDSQPLRLVGCIGASGGEFRFLAGRTLPFDVSGLIAESGAATTELAQPLGMPGVVLRELGASGRIYRKDSSGTTSTAVDLTVSGTVSFPSLAGFSLSGALVIDDSTVRLFVVTLTASPALSLTQFIQSILGAALSFASEITDQIAFYDASMYYLKAPANSPDSYRFSYLPAGSSTAIACESGFHISGRLRLFQRFDFLISISAQGREFSLTTSVPQKIDVFDFISLDNPSLEISNRSGNTHLRVRTTVSILHTPLSTEILADYDSGRRGFAGRISASLGNLSLPTDTGSSSHSVTLTVGFLWQNGLTITEISGLPTNDLSLISHYLQILNEVRRGGCEQIVSDWLNGVTSTRLTPSMNGSPQSIGSGQMLLPLQLTYQILVSGSSIASATIPFSAVITIPSSLSALPGAMWQSIVDSAGSIATDMLSNPETYKAIALEAMRRGGASAAARFICRMLAEGLEDLAKALAEAAADIVADSLAAAAELAGYLLAVSLLGVRAIISFFEAVWDEIKSWFGDHSKRDEAEAKVREVRRQVEGVVQAVDTRMADVKQRIGMSTLTTRLTESGTLEAAVVFNLGADKHLDPGSRLASQLRIQSGEAGDQGGAVLLQNNDVLFPTTVRFAEIPNCDNYRMNASARSVLSGFQFMNDSTRNTMQKAIDTLNGLDNGVATDFANYLKGKLNQFQEYNDVGISTDWVFAQAGSPTQMTIGQSYIGMNTRVTN